VTGSHEEPGTEWTPATPAPPWAPGPDSQSTSGDQGRPDPGRMAAWFEDSSAAQPWSYPDRPASSAPRSHARHVRTRRGWHGDWQVAVVLVVIALGVALLWLLHNSHQARQVALPDALLGLNRYTGPDAQAIDRRIAAPWRATGNAALVGLYGSLPGVGPGFEVGFGNPCSGNGCLMPTSGQLVQSLRQAGFTAAQAFPIGGGILACNSRTFETGQLIACIWADQAGAGMVIFSGGYATSLSDAAAKTRQIRAAIEH